MPRGHEPSQQLAVCKQEPFEPTHKQVKPTSLLTAAYNLVLENDLELEQAFTRHFERTCHDFHVEHIAHTPTLLSNRSSNKSTKTPLGFITGHFKHNATTISKGREVCPYHMQESVAKTSSTAT